ncbi:MAG: S26 family signal peptidase [Phycisphaerales bacterium]|jgi:signal peptidase I|nr:S26 family signal peptidase [Phycisphaerales bacterium]
MASTTPSPHAAAVKETIPETIISVIIAFALAFVFRAFVAEAYVIPTGSMAPTLNGAHVRAVSPHTGVDWAVGPSPLFYINNDPQNVQPFWGPMLARGTGTIPGNNEGLILFDPQTGQKVVDPQGKARSGDRIFVHKYLYSLAEPEAWDVIVFKDPTNPDQNFIKRLVGLPNEEIALVDGDVFVRKLPRPTSDKPAWEQEGWQIRRKPARVQAALWQTIHDTGVLPLASTASAPSPWRASLGVTAGPGGRTFAFAPAGSASGVLEWNVDAPFIPTPPRSAMSTVKEPNGQIVAVFGYSEGVDRTRAITDRYGYNQSPQPEQRSRFPVGDLRVRFGVQLSSGTSWNQISLTPVIIADGHEFRASVAQGRVQLQMRSSDGGRQGTWTNLGTEAPLPTLPTDGRAIVDVEFWHVDQTVSLYVAGQRVAYGAYDWTPAQRVGFALGTTIDLAAWPEEGHNPLDNGSLYRPSSVRLELGGGALTIVRLGVDRDVYYTPATRFDPHISKKTPALATHPLTPLALSPDQFFVCGDNSPASSDGRLWTSVDPWIASEIDAKVGIVDRRLLLGKAFFVYWPSIGGTGRIPVPDVGRMRFIQ